MSITPTPNTANQTHCPSATSAENSTKNFISVIAVNTGSALSIPSVGQLPIGIGVASQFQSSVSRSSALIVMSRLRK